MKTYTDTQRVDFIIRSLEGRNLIPIFRHVEACTAIDRGTIDAAMRVEDVEAEKARNSKRAELIFQRSILDRQISDLTP